MMIELLPPGAILILGGLLVVQLLGNFCYQYLSGRLGLRTVTRLRQRLFDHLVGLPSLYFTHTKAGDLSSRVTGDVGAIQNLLTNGLVGLVRALVTLVGATILMVRLNADLARVVVADEGPVDPRQQPDRQHVAGDEMGETQIAEQELVGRLASPDRDVVRRAAVALGHTGADAARAALRRSRRSAR